jgi:carboxypeptidase family protein/TonB-dependent receptor-like protein
MEKHKVLRIAVLLVFSSVGITLAQVTTGTISGTVKDSTGAVLPGAQVAILNEDTGISRKVQSDAAGRYFAPLLSLGTYSVTGSREGFRTVVRRGIVLTVGREAIVDLSLPVGAVAQTLEVTGEAPLVEATTASLSSLVDDRTIRALPLNGRSYDQLALLQPGVILTSPGRTSGSSFSEGTAKRFSVGGQRSYANLFLLDGTNINDQANGTPGGAAGTNLGVDTILEFKVFVNSYKAEYGNSTGGIVTVVTRSGTNTLHGTAFEYIRNSVLDARNFFDAGSVPPFKRNQFGGVVGGPIKKDKTFFFGGYEGLRQGLGTTLIAGVPTLQAKQGILPGGTVLPVIPAVVPYLNLYPLPNGRDFGDGTGEFLSSPTVVTNEDNYMVRVDHQLNAKTAIFGRYTFDNDSVNAPQSLPSFVQLTASRRQYTTLQTNSILGPQALNHFGLAFNRTNSLTDPVVTGPAGALGFVPGQPIGALRISGAARGLSVGNIVALGGTSTNGDGSSRWVHNIIQWGDDFTYVTGKHALKTGVDIERMRENMVKSNSVRGSYSFPTFQDLLAGAASSLQAGAPLGTDPHHGLRQTLYGIYGQDDYTVNSRLTLNLGLRWEISTDPYDVLGNMAIFPSPSATATVVSDKYFSIGKKNFEPRFGLAWQLDASGKTVLRVGGGIYHSQIMPFGYTDSLNLPPFFGTFSSNNPPFPDGYRLFLAPQAKISLKAMAPVIKTPVNDQFTLSIQHEIVRNTVVQVAYSGNKGNHLEATRDVDTAIPTILPDGRKFFPVGTPVQNTAWNGIRVFETNANSVYNSVTVTLRRQLSSGFVGQIFYTFSKAMDEKSNIAGSDSQRSPAGPLDPEDLGRDWGLAEFDSRHAVVANFSYQLPFRAGSKPLGAVVNGWTLDGIGTFTAGLPFTTLLASNVSRNQAQYFAERPDLKPGASQDPNHGISAGCPGFPAGTKVGGADNFYDPCSFSLPLAGTYGNLGRNTIIGPGVANVDLALGKSFKLHEKANVAFKAELFNIMNHANLGLPNQNSVAANGNANPAAGRISYTLASSRQIQFGLKINY